MSQHIQIVYIGGLFENNESSLFRSIKLFAQEQGEKCIFVESCLEETFAHSSFYPEILRINDIVKKAKSRVIIAHSLGAYCALLLQVNHNLVLLDPSLPISEIILPNVKDGQYADGQHIFDITQEFLESIKASLNIKDLSEKIKDLENISIVGAGNGGYKIAEQYHTIIKTSKYYFLPEADHWFSKKEDTEKIFQIIQSS